jgi:hypothetical protein
LSGRDECEAGGEGGKKDTGGNRRTQGLWGNKYRRTGEHKDTGDKTVGKMDRTTLGKRLEDSWTGGQENVNTRGQVDR